MKLSHLAVIFSACVGAVAVAGNDTIPTPNDAMPKASVAAPAAIKPTIVPAPPSVEATGYVLMDAGSGQVIASSNPDKRMAPASLTKIMTLYIISDALKNARLQLNDPVTISERAWRMGGSKMFIKIGDRIPAQDLIKGIIIASGNDACVSMSEHIAGSEESFVNLMNEHAKRLGMNNSHFTDCTGMPDPNHYTTPRDMAILARALVNDFPEYYKQWYSEKWFTFNGIRQPNRNRLLWQNPVVDGIKTGHTDEAGYCLVASGMQKGMRLISVTMGCRSDKTRTEISNALLTYGFRFYESHRLYADNTPLATPRVWFGDKKSLPIGVTSSITATLPIGSYGQLQTATQLNTPLKAPILKGQVVGQLTVKSQDKVIAQQPLIALESIQSGGMFSRLSDYLRLSWSGEDKNTNAANLPAQKQAT